jgi:DMSO/TMAO reductase YedYZ molybdopterin-dependent catalytic subunit
MHDLESVKNHAGRLIDRERDPVNLESPFEELAGLLTPNDLFYVRNHFAAPQIEAGEFELSIAGAVENPFAIGYEELRSMTSVTRTVTLECAGNGRLFLTPPVEGVQWGLGAIGTAEWIGVPLSALLRRAKVAEDAVEIVLEGADRGTPKEKSRRAGEIQYARSVERHRAGEVLLAWAMNGADLTRDHGFPLRAIVPGYYGMASVKWLTNVTAVREPFAGYFQTTDYAYWAEMEGSPVRRPLTSMRLKSSIARPRMGEMVKVGSRYTVFGAAWGGEADLARVEVSCDAGKSWQAAEMLDETRPFVWSRWQFAWDAPAAAGTCILKSRAIDAAGNVQPEEHDERFGSYVVHHTVGVEVEVR